MAKNQYVYQNQLKTIVALEQKISDLIAKYRSLSGGDVGILFRTIFEPNQATLYMQGSHVKGVLQNGVREVDYKFCAADPAWIEPSDVHGLSFSSTFNQVKFTMDLLGKFQKDKTKVDTAYWISEGSQSIPEGMAFKQDPKNSEHYFLVVTKKMLLTTLIANLKQIGYRMTVMTELRLEVRKQ